MLDVMAERDTELTAPLEVDRESLLELARGGNLYQDRFACMRELIQNAADATLLRLFAERGAAAFPTYEGSMRDLRAALADYPIDVSIERLGDDTSGPEPVHRYRVVVEDHGTGIRREDIPHLQRIGSSRKNPTRAALIDAMPEWMRPSGTFGIGLQSAFLVSDELILDTRSLDGQAHTIVLRARDGGTIEVRKGTRGVVGTRVEMVVGVPPGIQHTRMAWRVDHERDPTHDVLLDPEIDVELEGAAILAADCGRGSLVPVRVNGRAIATEFSGARATFDPETLVEFVLPTHADDASPVGRDLAARAKRCGDPHKPTGFYRGAPLATGASHDVRFAMNLHAGTARECLVLSRDVLSSAGASLLTARFESVVCRHVPAHLQVLDASADAPKNLRCRLSLLLKGFSHAAAGESWRMLVVAVTKETDRDVTLGEVADGGRLERVRHIRHARAFGSEPRTSYTVLADGTLASDLLPDAQDWVNAVLPGAQLISLERHVRLREPGFDVTREYFLDELARTTRGQSLRPMFARPSELHALRLPRENAETRRGDYRMLSPWTFRDGAVDVPHVLKWITWTARPDDGPPRTEAEVAAGLVTLLRLGDPVLRADAALTVVYDLEAVIAEIERAYPGVGARSAS